MDKKQYFLCAAAGAGAGIVSGLLGAGGGMLLIPLLSVFVHPPEDKLFPLCVSSCFPSASSPCCTGRISQHSPGRKPGPTFWAGPSEARLPVRRDIEFPSHGSIVYWAYSFFGEVSAAYVRRASLPHSHRRAFGLSVRLGCGRRQPAHPMADRCAANGTSSGSFH